MRNIIVGFLVGVMLASTAAWAIVERTPMGTRFGGDGKEGYPQVIVPVPGETVVPAFPRQERPC